MNEEIFNSYPAFKFEKKSGDDQEIRQPFADDQTDEELPILKYKAEIGEMIYRQPTTIIVGETGSGKTTQIPLIIWETLGENQKVAITQPRRLATRSVASYVAKKIGCQIGQEVGYQIRFEDRTTEGTRINFMTDGILLRKIQEDPLLREYSAVMVDEAHERSLNIDFVLGLLKRLQRRRREANLPPLKIIVTSATLEKEKFAQYFGNAPILEIPGRLYPVEIHYEGGEVSDYIYTAVERVRRIITEEKEGDILIFMPGQEEIFRTIERIQKLNLEEVEVLPLYGEMDPEDQDKIFTKTNKRKIVVATNIAETSVTVPGIRYVIDTGLIKQINYNPSSGIETLQICRHSKSGCIQRAGRAGRIASGECWRLYTEEDFTNRPEFQTPEIKRSNLAHVVLMMKQIGIEDIFSFEFIDPPTRESLEEAVETLKTLGALNDKEEITEIGRLMAELPLEPRIAKMVIEAERYNCVEAICTIAAFLGGRSVFVRPKGKEMEADPAHRVFKISGSDFLSLLKVWQEYEVNKYNSAWAHKNFLSSKVLAEVQQIRYQLFRALRRNGIRVSQPPEPEAIGKSITASYLDNLLIYEGDNCYRRVKDNLTDIYLHPSSVNFSEKPLLLVAAEIVRTNRIYARLTQVVKPEWLYEIAPHLLEKVRRELNYDETQDRLQARYALFLGSSNIGEIQEEPSGEEAVDAFAEILAKGTIDLPFVRHNKQVLETIEDIRLRSEGKEPKQRFSHEELKMFYKERLRSIASRKALEEALERQEIDLRLDLESILPEETRKRILQENPDTIKILDQLRPVSYRYEKGEFSASVKITEEEIFKLEEIPCLPSGRRIYLKVVDSEDEDRVLASGDNLNEMKERVKNYLIKKQWEEWLKTEPDAKPKELINFDPFSEEIPPLPEPRQFGVDPMTGAPLWAFPAIEIEVSYYTGNRYWLKFFPSKLSAEAALDRCLSKIEEFKEQRRQEEEKQRLLKEAKELLEKLNQRINEVGSNYNSEYGFSYNEWSDLQASLDQAKTMIAWQSVEALNILKKIDERLEKAFAYREAKKHFEGLIEEEIKKYYSNCPLCDDSLAEGLCTDSRHNLDRIRFEMDAQGNRKKPALLSQIVTDNGKIVAQLYCSNGRDKYYPGHIYLLRGEQILVNGWRGEPFEELRYEDFNKIISEEEAAKISEERYRAEMKAYYKEKFERAKQKVERGEFAWGQFVRAKHPKTGAEQWERTIKSGGLTVKYVVDRFGKQPTSEDFAYFYSEKRPLVDNPSLKIILVQLEEPFPEDQPEDLVVEAEEILTDTEDSEEETDISSKLEELRNKWGAR